MYVCMYIHIYIYIYIYIFVFLFVCFVCSARNLPCARRAAEAVSVSIATFAPRVVKSKQELSLAWLGRIQPAEKTKVSVPTAIGSKWSCACAFQTDNFIKVELRMRVPNVPLHAHRRDYITGSQDSWVEAGIGSNQHCDDEGFCMFAPNCWLHALFCSRRAFLSLVRSMPVATKFAVKTHTTTQVSPNRHPTIKTQIYIYIYIYIITQAQSNIHAQIAPNASGNHPKIKQTPAQRHLKIKLKPANDHTKCIQRQPNNT